MKFKLELKCDNAAFFNENTGEREPYDEVARILRRIAETVEAGHDYGLAVDYNGNSVGEWKLFGKGVKK